MAGSILLLVSSGFAEKEVLSMNMDKFMFYVDVAQKNKNETRHSYVLDTVCAISGALNGVKKIEKYLKSLDGE